METETDSPSTTDRKITLDWPDPPIEFQTIELGWKPKFPALMVPWGGGRQIIYSIDDQNTFWPKVPPAWWLYPKTKVHVAGEEYHLGMGALKFAFAFWFNLTHPNSGGIQIDAAEWLINDIYEPDLDANTRAYHLVNLPAQPAGVKIARPVQVSDKANFNRYLEQFKETGYIGALVRDPKADYYNTQHAVILPIE